jgi:hypothetical protein
VIERPRLLAAEVEIALAAGDLPAARAAADELGRLGGLLGATFLEALAGQAEATVLRAEGRPREALTAARRAWSLWRRLDVPFEAARSRLTVSLSNRDLGDHDGAETELAAARGLFEQLHADSALRFVEPVEPHPMEYRCSISRPHATAQRPSLFRYRRHGAASVVGAGCAFDQAFLFHPLNDASHAVALQEHPALDVPMSQCALRRPVELKQDVVPDQRWEATPLQLGLDTAQRLLLRTHQPRPGQGSRFREQFGHPD